MAGLGRREGGLDGQPQCFGRFNRRKKLHKLHSLPDLLALGPAMRTLPQVDFG
jgi:hypothetical protein